MPDWQKVALMGGVIGMFLMTGLIISQPSDHPASQPEETTADGNEGGDPSVNRETMTSEVTPTETIAAATPVPTPIPTPEAPNPQSNPQISNPRPSAVARVEEQYQLVSSRQYQEAWSRLHPNFRNNRSIFTNGYNSYTDWWDTVSSSEAQNAQVIEQTDDRAIVNTQVKLQMRTGETVYQPREITLLWNQEAEDWMISQTRLLN
jgi:hypothetical protein